MQPIDKVRNAINICLNTGDTLRRLEMELQSGYGPRCRDLADTARLHLKLTLEYVEALERT